MSRKNEVLALVGLPGAGKTTVGAILASGLGRRLVDTDAEVGARSGRSPAAIITGGCERELRELELAVIEHALSDPSPAVIACGGGLFAQPPAQALLSAFATVVCLDAPDRVLLDRLGDLSDHPLLHGDDPAARLAEMRRERAGMYARADLRVPSAASPDQVAERIQNALGHSRVVEAASRSSLLTVRRGAVDDVVLHLPAGARRVALVSDLAVRARAKALASRLKADGRAVSLIGLRGGEQVKTWAAAGRLLARFGAIGLRRGDCVVAMGGGTVGDLAGFVAATHLRGVAWINVPTTLMAMADSAVGGKTGVNLRSGKNLAGAFWQPRAILCDPALLATLPERHYRSALAEVVKCSMVFEDGLYTILEQRIDELLNRDESAVTDVVRRCSEAKAAVVEEDEKEAGRRAILNYGHTVGHALEAATGFGPVLNHGEAVAVGMRVAGALSVEQCGCPPDHIAWQDETLRRCGLGDAPRVAVRGVMSAIHRDKKHSGDTPEPPRHKEFGGVGWVLLESRGHPRYGQVVPEHLVEAELRRVLRS